MPDKRIVYTRPDGCVSICTPSDTALRYMTNGGGRWDGFPRGFLDRQIAEQSKYGVGERAASRFVQAMQYGGCTDAEAWGVMRDRYCAHLGTGFELWFTNDLPDRWFRDAWTRSHNGGPIGVDMKNARRIQFTRIAHHAKKNRFRLKIDLWKQRVMRARQPEDLKLIWPSL